MVGGPKLFGSVKLTSNSDSSSDSISIGRPVVHQYEEKSHQTT
jgi:hypothetical protein